MPHLLLTPILLLAPLPGMGATQLPPPGEWVSRSYGYHLSARADGYVVYDVLGDACTRRRDPTPLFDEFAPEGTQRLRARVAHEPYDYRFERVSAPCRIDGSRDPERNLAAMRQFFAQHYAFDAERGIQPPSADDRGMDAFDESTVRAFIARYRDAHVSFSGMLDGEEVELDADPGLVDVLTSRIGAPFLKTYWSRHVAEDILGGKGRFAAQRRIQYGVIDGDIGYLGLVSMGGYAPQETHDDLAVLDAVLAQMADQFKTAGVRGVIVDLSANSGGYDHLARRLAGQFTDHPVDLYCKQVRKPPGDRQCMRSDPARSALHVPVAVLTSRLTVSAAEIAVLSLRAQGAVHLGEPTRGALSDALVKYLPGGATITLSNEVYTDVDGHAWEATGIAPDQPAPNLDTADPLGSHAALVRAAAERLRDP